MFKARTFSRKWQRCAFSHSSIIDRYLIQGLPATFSYDLAIRDRVSGSRCNPPEVTHSPFPLHPLDYEIDSHVTSVDKNRFTTKAVAYESYFAIISDFFPLDESNKSIAVVYKFEYIFNYRIFHQIFRVAVKT